MSTLIVTGGTINKSFILKYIKDNIYNNIIAVDKGLEILDLIKVVPNYILGDFDSVSSEVLNKYEGNKKVKIYKYSSEKDYTDTHIATNLAITLKENIDIIGAIGSRLDHTIANIYVLKESLDRNIKIRIINEKNKIQLINKETIIKKDKRYKYVSLIALTEKAEGISLKGFKYKLSEYTLKSGESIGISNEIVEKQGKIQIKKGILICIESRD